MTGERLKELLAGFALFMYSSNIKKNTNTRALLGTYLKYPENGISGHEIAELKTALEKYADGHLESDHWEGCETKIKMCHYMTTNM